jgi:putative hydrolase of the HAD superfamily
MPIMPLMMLDLDNTLIDRDSAFRSAATEFLAAHRLPGEDLGWMMTADASGYTPRSVLAEAITMEAGFRPTHTAGDAASAIRYVLAAMH